MKIGLIDSGVGGLTVLKEFLKLFPMHEYIYLGDTKRVPYGDKSKETIKILTKKLIDFLEKRSVDLIIIACHTMSTVYLNETKNKYNSNVIGVSTATIEYILEKKINNIGVIGTKATINSNFYNKILTKNKIKVVSKACPLFVPMIEENIKDKILVNNIVKYYLDDLKNIQHLILGCTHYPIIEQQIKKVLPNTSIINPSLIIAQYIKKNNLLSKECKTNITLYFTDININTNELIERLIPNNIKIKKCVIE